MKKLLALAAAVILGSPLVAYSNPISYGALSSDDSGSTQIIHDSLNNLDWLRWDVSHLTYSETLAAMTSGGSLDGWQIAHIDQAQQFTNALLDGQSNTCTAADTGLVECNSNVGSGLGDLFGDDNGAGSPGIDDDVAFFLSDNGVGQEMGLLEYRDSDSSSEHFLSKINEWGFTSQSDFYAETISLLLYRPAKADDTTPPSSVPEPGMLALFALGLCGAGMLRRMRRSAAH